MTSFRQLLASMPSTTGKKKLPTAKQLENETIYEQTPSITLYTNGYFTYTDGSHITVYAVDRCSKMAFYHGASTDERNKWKNIIGCDCYYVENDAVLKAIVPFEEYADLDWETVLTIIGENRLIFNELKREEKKEARDINDAIDTVEDEKDQPGWITPERMQLVKEARKTLTKSQEEIIHLHFDKEMSNKEIAKKLGITPSAVTERLNSALGRMRKKVFEKS